MLAKFSSATAGPVHGHDEGLLAELRDVLENPPEVGRLHD